MLRGVMVRFEMWPASNFPVTQKHQNTNMSVPAASCVFDSWKLILYLHRHVLTSDVNANELPLSYILSLN